jgi:hypothetical protein
MSGQSVNQGYDVTHGMIPLPGGILSAGDVWKFTGSGSQWLVNGTSYTVTAVSLYQFTPPTFGNVGPDSVVLTGGVYTASAPAIVSVDTLISNFTRTTVNSHVSPTGNQIPPAPSTLFAIFHPHGR